MKNIIGVMFLALLGACYSRNAPETKTGLEGKPMPIIELTSVDSVTRFSTVDIPAGKPTILFSFEPWCPYCRAQTKSIIKNIQTLNDVNIYMISNSRHADLKKFYNEYKLNQYSNIKTGIDNKSTFNSYFKSSQIPFLAIYDKNKNLQEVLIGKNYISTIKNIIYKK
jgi:thiol-disulfide isomerase/thioredoxin